MKIYNPLLKNTIAKIETRKLFKKLTNTNMTTINATSFKTISSKQTKKTINPLIIIAIFGAIIFLFGNFGKTNTAPVAKASTPTLTLEMKQKEADRKSKLLEIDNTLNEYSKTSLDLQKKEEIMKEYKKCIESNPTDFDTKCKPQ